MFVSTVAAMLLILSPLFWSLSRRFPEQRDNLHMFSIITFFGAFFPFFMLAEKHPEATAYWFTWFIKLLISGGGCGVIFGTLAYAFHAEYGRITWLGSYRAKSAIDLIPGPQWATVRNHVLAVGTIRIPWLFRKIIAIKGDIKKIRPLTGNALSDKGKGDLAVNPDEHLKALEAELKKYQTELQDSLAMLREFSSVLYTVKFQHKDGDEEAMPNAMRELIKKTVNVDDQFRQALVEVDAATGGPERDPNRLEPPRLARIASATSDKDSA